MLVQALERVTDAEMSVRVELSLAHVEAELGATVDGVHRCEEALGRTGVTRHVQGLVWSQLGLLRMRAGDAEAALAAFGQAEPLLEEGDHEALGNLLLNRGNVRLQRQEAEAALADFATAVEHFDAGHLEVHRDKARNNLGYAKLLVGDLAGAVTDLDAAYATLSEQGPVIAATCDQDRAEALMAAGLPEDAAVALERAADAFGRQRFRQGQGEVLLQLARLRLRDNQAEARRVARRATRVFGRRGSDTWAVRAEAVALAAEAGIGNGRHALPEDAARVGRALREQGFVHDAVMLEMQVVRHELDANQGAAAERRLAAVPERDDEPLDNRLVRQEVRASVAVARRRPEDALAEVRAGLDELAAWQRSFGSLDLQSSFVGHGRRLARTGIGLALEDGRPDIVLEWIDRSRALATRVAPLRAPDDSRAAADLALLRDLRARIRAAEEAGDDADALLAEHRDLQRRIRERAWHTPGSGTVREAVTLPQVQRALADDDGVLVAHVTDGERMYALVTDAEHAGVVEVGSVEPIGRLLDGMRADLDVAASKLPTGLQAVVNDSLAARLGSLSGVLLGPLQERLTAGRPIVLVPPGALAGTPWTLLPALREHPVSVARSVSLWSTERPDSWATPQSAALVAGPRVPRAEEEIGRADAWGSSAVRLVGEDATAEAVAAAASGADVLHLAAHGLHSADNPLFSGVELADGPWFGYDIDGLDRVPATVLLSACELGRSTVRWGEEAIGMTAAWLHAGAQAVIASPAAVDDDVACEVLAGTHIRLAAGSRPAVALRDAVNAAGLQADSSFVCFGRGW